MKLHGLALVTRIQYAFAEGQGKKRDTESETSAPKKERLKGPLVRIAQRGSPLHRPSSEAHLDGGVPQEVDDTWLDWRDRKARQSTTPCQ